MLNRRWLRNATPAEAEVKVQGRPYMRKVICKGNETGTVKPSNNA